MAGARRWGAAAALLALLLGAAARRLDQDFEFDDDAESTLAASAERRARRYVYDPQNALCGALVCKKREVCLLRDAYTALCASKTEVLRRGDAIVWGGGGAEDTDEVFYESGGGGGGGGRGEGGGGGGGGGGRGEGGGRCVGCGGGARAQFLCGSDNRTYSSLCRLDLHNCVRRGRAPVAVACRGFCPCRREPACRLDRMADRLLDWFSVLMEEARGAAPPPAGYPAACKPEVRWMFSHLDADGDGRLSAGELYALRHDERERCLRPFLASCGGGGAVSRRAWCGCLRGAARACAALARAARRGGGGGWAPACDARGFYRPRQCHAQLAQCWCVDAHGAELPGTRTKGEPPCAAAPAQRPAAPHRAAPAPHDDDEDAPAGSGDGAAAY